MSAFGGTPEIEQWLVIARTDWKRIQRNLRDEDAAAAGFYLQQCLEKYLKAFLLMQGWKLRKIHELDALLDEAIHHMPELQTFYELCERVSNYYLADRYPPLGMADLSCDDVTKDLAEAGQFIHLMFPAEELNR